MDVLDEEAALALALKIRGIPRLEDGHARAYEECVEKLCGCAVAACHDPLIMALDISYSRLIKKGAEIDEDIRERGIRHIRSHYTSPC